jgi:DNA-binding NtrC family response regulator
MIDQTILTIPGDDRFLDLLRAQLRVQSDAGSRMIVSQTIDEACSLLASARPRLIVVHWNRQSRYDELNRLLWATTVSAHRVPVLVVADRYRVDQATTLYRMGVTEYISRTHHLDCWGRILEGYLSPSRVPKHRVASPEDAPQSVARAWSAPPSQGTTARVV